LLIRQTSAHVAKRNARRTAVCRQQERLDDRAQISVVGCEQAFDTLVESVLFVVIGLFGFGQGGLLWAYVPILFSCEPESIGLWLKARDLPDRLVACATSTL
jgi:hypothetical protein